MQDASKDYSKRRVLVADDDLQAGTIVKSVIERRLGCYVARANDGDEAVKLLEADPYDVFVTDMFMPGIHGLDLVALVRERWPGTDVIVITGFPSDFPYVEVIQAGASDFLGKPHHPEELEAKLVRVLREREARDAQVLAEMKYRSLFELSVNGMVLLHPESHTIVDNNRSFCELTGLSKEELLGRPLADLLSPANRERFGQGMSILSSTGQLTLGDLKMERVDGEELWLDVSATIIDGLPERIVLLAFKDVTEKREVEAQLAQIAQTDQLTGLANKHTFNTRMEWAVARARSESFALTLLALDLDNFKQCNDTQGHLVGDQVLAKVGEVIRSSIRVGGDEGFRCGGDEFNALLVGAPLPIGLKAAEHIRAEFAKMENFGTSLSIGVAEFEEGMSAKDLMRAADEALYKAKAQGKDGVAVAGPKSDV